MPTDSVENTEAVIDSDEADEFADLHADALTEFDNIYTVVFDEREQSIEDRRFYSIPGAQWGGNLGKQFQNKPKFEINKLMLSIIKIFNEWRNNRIDVEFTSRDGTDAADLADVCAGLYRADEKDSGAQEAHDNAFEEAVGGGMGAFRLRAEFEDDEDDDDDRQRIRIEPIFDADTSVFFDLQAKRQDKADADHCFVLFSMTPEAYKDRYDDDPQSWPTTIVNDTSFEWANNDVVFVAEYYKVERETETIRIFRTVDNQEERFTQSEFNADDELFDRITAQGMQELRQKKVTRRKVHKYVMSGGRVLEDNGIIAGKYIPIIPVYGKRWFVDSIERFMGHVRLAKDAQRLFNVELSKVGEIASLSSIAKPIFTPGQIKDHEAQWRDDNIEDYAFLLVNPIVDAEGNELPAGPIAHTLPPDIPPAIATLLTITSVELDNLLGNQQQGDKMVSNISGKAIEMIQQRLDGQAFIYVSNMAKAIQWSGVVWLSMAKEVYVEPKRRMKTIDATSGISSVELNQTTVNTDTAAIETENDLSSAKFDCNVEVGPASLSRKQATVRAVMDLMGVMTDDPEALQILSNFAAMNMEGEGIKDLNEFFRKRSVQAGVTAPTDEEAEEMAAAAQNAKEDPNAEFLRAAADEAEANAVSKRADVLETLADVEKKRAETAAILAGIDGDKLDRLMALLETQGVTAQELTTPNQLAQPTGAQ